MINKRWITFYIAGVFYICSLLVAVWLSGCSVTEEFPDSGLELCDDICDKIKGCDWYDDIMLEAFDGGLSDMQSRYDFCVEVCTNGDNVENYRCLNTIENCDINTIPECF